MTETPRRLMEGLDELKAMLFMMSGLIEARLHGVLAALVNRQQDVLADVVSGDARIDKAQHEIDERCLVMLAVHQPVAVDLRTIVSVLKINADLERVNELALRIGEAAQRYVTHPQVKPLVDLPRMGELARRMLKDALHACLSSDVALAKAVLRQDDWLGTLRSQVVRETLTYMIGNSATIEPGIDLMLIAHHLERIGGHATNIAEDVVFIVEGRDVRLRSTGPVMVERRRSDSVAPA
jgi:phosphate transport system protein